MYLLEFWCMKSEILSAVKLDSAGYSVTFLFWHIFFSPGTWGWQKVCGPCGAPWYVSCSDGGNSSSAPSPGERLFLSLYTMVRSTLSTNASSLLQKKAVCFLG